jgi:acyl dehydratase
VPQLALHLLRWRRALSRGLPGQHPGHVLVQVVHVVLQTSLVPTTIQRHPSVDLPRASTAGSTREGGSTRLSRMMTPKPGTTARRSRQITHRDIELFTEISGDHNPIHYDESVAAMSRFGRVVVQGGVTSGLLNALVAEDLPGPGSVFLEVNWRFLAPVSPGDVITATATVTAARDDKPITTLATTITNQAGTVVLDGTAVVWRDPAVAGAAEA